MGRDMFNLVTVQEDLTVEGAFGKAVWNSEACECAGHD